MGRVVSNEIVSINRVCTFSAQQYEGLTDVPPEVEWLANITNSKTRRSYKADVAEFVSFTGLKESAQLRTVTRAHLIAWRENLNRSRAVGRKCSAHALGAVVTLQLSM
jgi:integrase/recombinase XerD